MVGLEISSTYMASFLVPLLHVSHEVSLDTLRQTTHPSIVRVSFVQMSLTPGILYHLPNPFCKIATPPVNGCQELEINLPAP